MAGSVQVNVWMDPELRCALREEAVSRGVSLGALVRLAFEALLSQEKRVAESRSLEDRVAALERLAGQSY